jgi:hypothetical protein
LPHTLKNKTPHILVASMMLAGMPAIAHANAAAPELSQTEVMSDLVNPWDIAFF